MRADPEGPREHQQYQRFPAARKIVSRLSYLFSLFLYYSRNMKALGFRDPIPAIILKVPPDP